MKMRNKILETGGKTILVIKWQITWRHVHVLVFCVLQKVQLVLRGCTYGHPCDLGEGSQSTCNEVLNHLPVQFTSALWSCFWLQILSSTGQFCPMGCHALLIFSATPRSQSSLTAPLSLLVNTIIVGFWLLVAKHYFLALFVHFFIMSLMNSMNTSFTIIPGLQRRPPLNIRALLLPFSPVHS